MARRVHEMAAERGMDLPDVIRMMLTKAIRNNDFAIDEAVDGPPPQVEDPPYQAFEPRYWGEDRAALDAEAALAALHQAIAHGTATLDAGLSLKVPDLARLERVRTDRDEACEWLAKFDPKDATAVAAILKRFGTGPRSGASPTSHLGSEASG